MHTTAERWDEVYEERGIAGVSWYQSDPAVSLDLIESAHLEHGSPIIDIGGGASLLVDRLLDGGYTDLTVLDLSAVALAAAQARLGDDNRVTWIHGDVLSLRPARQFDLWHDRAAFHFLVDPLDIERYFKVLHRSLAPGGVAVIGTFADDGPEWCSGLPVARYSEAALLAFLGEGFVPFATHREVHHTPAAGEQPFTWLAARLAR